MKTVDTVDWNTLGKCNLRCLHCYGPDKRLGSLPHASMMRIIERMSEMRVKRVVLTGGEPLITPNISEILGELQSRGFEVALSTNGTFVDDMWDVIARNVSSLNLPLDGHTPELHALSREDTSTFYTNVEAIRRFARSPGNRPVKLRVGTVYSEATKGYMSAIAEFLLEFSDAITTWKIYELIEHEMQPELRVPIIHQSIDFVREMDALFADKRLVRITEKAMVAPAESRNKAYFMINPKGLVVVPTKIGGVTVERVIGHFLKDPIGDILERWSISVDFGNYQTNHNRHYEK